MYFEARTFLDCSASKAECTVLYLNLVNNLFRLNAFSKSGGSAGCLKVIKLIR